jgi:hypothetical protein
MVGNHPFLAHAPVAVAWLWQFTELHNSTSFSSPILLGPQNDYFTQ